MSSPAAALRRLISRSIAMHDVVAASLGINATDLQCLELLEAHPGVTPSRLAELAALTSGAVTGVLDRLEAAGFVRRESDPDDRRRVIVRPLSARMAEVTAAYEPLIAKAAKVETDGGLAATVDALASALATETDRLRVATEGGMLGDTYRAPMAPVTRARLHLLTGAPRINVNRTGFGQQVRMVAETAATRLRLSGSPAADELIRATFVGPPPDVRSSDGSVTMRYRRRLLDTRSREIEAQLNRAATWSIEVDGGITDLVADLRDTALGGVDIHGGANHLRLRLGHPTGTVRIGLEGGASDVRLDRPAGVPMAVVSRGGIEDLRLDGARKRATATDLHRETAGYGAAPDRYLVELDGSVARLAVREDR